jgi:hypothetical protein
MATLAVTLEHLRRHGPAYGGLHHGIYITGIEPEARRFGTVDLDVLMALSGTASVDFHMQLIGHPSGTRPCYSWLD